MLTVFSLGFLLGLRHAMEADHIAAIASLASRTQTLRHSVPIAMLWGLGHTTTLVFFGAIVLLFDTVVPAALSQSLETAVGIMLVALGIDVLYRLRKERIHFHANKHGPEVPHFHAHMHQKKTTHDMESHNHEHSQGLSFRAFLVGSMHGMAGSAALILITLQSIESIGLGLVYISLFGIGSIVGMALLSAAIAIPMAAASENLTQLYAWFRGGVGTGTIGLGIFTVIFV